MSMREDKTDRLKQEAPNQNTGDQIKNTAAKTYDQAASYIPGQSKPRDALDSNARDPHASHDTGRQGAGAAISNAVKPSGEQSMGDWAQQKYDQNASKAQPNENKSYAQQMTDFVTPGNTGPGQGQGQGGQGITDQITGMATGAKDGVMNIFSGDNQKSGTNHEQR